MAKKRASTKRQQTFDADGFPKDPPKAVLDARDEFITAKREASDAAAYRGDREQMLIERMKEHGIQRLPLDGENKFIEIDAPEKAKIKTVPKEQRDAREGKE